MPVVRAYILCATLLCGLAAAQSTGATKAPRIDPVSELAGTWLFRPDGSSGAGCFLDLTSSRLMSSYRLSVSEGCLNGYSMFLGTDRWAPASSKIFRMFVGRLRDVIIFQRREDGSYYGKFSQDGKVYVMTKVESEASPASVP